MTSEQQVILLLSLIGVLLIAVGFWLKFRIDREEKRERTAAHAHPAE